MVHSSRGFAFAVLLMLPLLCECTPPTPQTQLTWDANEAPQAHYAARSTPRTYTYHDTDEAYVTPTPRPVPAVAHCSCEDNAPVTSSSLAPVSSGAVSFAWPVSGPVISNFGSELERRAQ